MREPIRCQFAGPLPFKKWTKKVSFLRKLVKTSYTDGFCTKRLLTRPHKKAEAILCTSLRRFSYRIGLSSEKFELCSQGITYFMLGVKTSSRFSLLVWSSFHFVQFLLWKSMSVRRVMGWGGGGKVGFNKIWEEVCRRNPVPFVDEVAAPI